MKLDVYDKMISKIDRIIFCDRNMSPIDMEMMIIERELRYSDVIVKDRVKNAFEYIRKSKLLFDDLEVILYGLMNMIYIYIDIQFVDNLYCDVESYIHNLSIDIKNRGYLDALHGIVYINKIYTCDIISNVDKISYERCEKYEKEKYRDAINSLKDIALKKLPDGKIIKLINEVYMLEDFFKEPNDEKIDELQRSCFKNKDNWIEHILLSEGSRLYLPYVELITGYSGTYDRRRTLIESFKHQYMALGSWSVESESERDERLKEWGSICYDQIFMKPYKIHTEVSNGGVVYKLLRLLLDNKILEETKNNIVSDFVHSYGNYEIDNIYNIAKALHGRPSKDDLEEFSRELLLEYLNKQMMSREVKILGLEHKENFELLKKEISNSINRSKNGVDVFEIVEASLRRVVLRILLETGNKRIDDIINKYEKVGKDVYDLLESFEREVIVEEKNCIKWVQKNLNELYIGIHGEWRGMFFNVSSYGQTFLMSLFMELFYNMFTYADISYKMKFTLEYKRDKKCNYYIIETENVIDNNISSNTKRGLVAKNRLLSKINYGKDYLWNDSLIKLYRENGNVFLVKARIKGEVFDEL